MLLKVSHPLHQTIQIVKKIDVGEDLKKKNTTFRFYRYQNMSKFFEKQKQIAKMCLNVLGSQIKSLQSLLKTQFKCSCCIHVCPSLHNLEERYWAKTEKASYFEISHSPKTNVGKKILQAAFLKFFFFPFVSRNNSQIKSDAMRQQTFLPFTVMSIIACIPKLNQIDWKLGYTPCERTQKTT